VEAHHSNVSRIKLNPMLFQQRPELLFKAHLFMMCSWFLIYLTTTVIFDLLTLNPQTMCRASGAVFMKGSDSLLSA
jgi:hypothetical protein